MKCYHYSTNERIDAILAKGVLEACHSVDVGVPVLWWTKHPFFERAGSYGKVGRVGSRTRWATSLCVSSCVPHDKFQDEITRVVLGSYIAEGLSFFRIVVDDSDSRIPWYIVSRDFGLSPDVDYGLEKLGWRISGDVTADHWLSVESLDFKAGVWWPFEWRLRRDLALFDGKKVLDSKK